MVHIHRHFSQLFQEWFSTLIDDENIYAQLDDSFAPSIQQNGYEVSFSELSGGEKTSAALAYRLALNKVINDVIHTINTKDIFDLRRAHGRIQRRTAGQSARRPGKTEPAADHHRLPRIKDRKFCAEYHTGQ